MTPSNYENRNPRIFVVDDQPTVADSLAGILKLSGYEAHARYTSAALLDLATEITPDLLIADVVLDPNSINGIDLAIYLKRFHPECQVILISGNPHSFETQNRARIDRNHFVLLAKPVPPEKLLREVSACLGPLRKAA